MKIRVILLGQARSAAGRDRVEIECGGSATVAVVLALLAEQFGDTLRHVILDDAGKPHASVMLFLNDEQIRGMERALHDRDELTLMPPISGG